jgi:hypothetical protein
MSSTMSRMARRERRRHHLHARPQREFGDKAACGGPNGGLVTVELSVGEFVAQTHDRGVFAIHCYAIRLPGTIFRSDSLGGGLFCPSRLRVAVSSVACAAFF